MSGMISEPHRHDQYNMQLPKRNEIQNLLRWTLPYSVRGREKVRYKWVWLWNDHPFAYYLVMGNVNPRIRIHNSWSWKDSLHLTKVERRSFLQSFFINFGQAERVSRKYNRSTRTKQTPRRAYALQSIQNEYYQKKKTTWAKWWMCVRIFAAAREWSVPAAFWTFSFHSSWIFPTLSLFHQHRVCMCVQQLVE